MAGSPSPMLVILILAFVILFYILKFVQESQYFRKLLSKTENNVAKGETKIQGSSYNGIFQIALTSTFPK